jgi:hypothetical protein
VPTFTSKIAGRILERIRSRTEELSARRDGAAEVPAATAPVAVREAQFSDFERVSAMNRRLGQGADSLENWQRLWRDNPALSGGRVARVGWVLESGGEVAGFLGSIPLEVSFGGTTLEAAATCRLAVEPAHRSATHLLVTSFFRQKNVDLFLNTSATVAAGKIMTALRAVPLPQPDYGEVLFWVLRPRTFAQAVLQRAGFSRGVSMFGSTAGGTALRADIALRRRGPRSWQQSLSVTEMRVDEMGADFAAFWAAREHKSAALFAKRTPEIMRWHFQAPGSRKLATVLACRKGDGVLAGYAIVRHEPAKDSLQRSVVADLMTASDDPTIIDALIAAAHRVARRAGSAVLEVLGYPSEIRAALRRWRPYARQYPACPYFFKARDAALQKNLSMPDAWYACPYDGDATLWP